MFKIGDLVGYGLRRGNVYGIVVGFTHNDYYYINWFDGHGNPWLVPFHNSTLFKASENHV